MRTGGDFMDGEPSSGLGARIRARLEMPFLPSFMQDVFQASFSSPIIPSGSVAFLTQRPVRRLQNKMALWERKSLLSTASDHSVLFSAFPLPQMVLITGPLKPVLCQLVLAAHSTPPPLFGNGGGGSLPSCVCVCVLRWGKRL